MITEGAGVEAKRLRAERRENRNPRRDDETCIADIQPVRFRIDGQRMRAVVQRDLIERRDCALAIAIDHAELAGPTGYVNSMEPGIVSYRIRAAANGNRGDDAMLPHIEHGDPRVAGAP